MRLIERATLADALHHAGRRPEAETRFGQAESIQAELQPECSMLYSLSGFRYCDLLLGEPERAAWRRLFEVPERVSRAELDTARVPSDGAGARHSIHDDSFDDSKRLTKACRSVSRRATQTLDLAARASDILSIGLDHLTLARATLYEANLGGERQSGAHLNESVDLLRRSGNQDELPRGLLTRALWRGASGDLQGAREDLDEAFEIAERGPMRLHLADIHFHRARLFGLMANRPADYPWVSARGDLDAARKLIEDCGYGRRREELADAEAAWERLYATPAPRAAT